MTTDLDGGNGVNPDGLASTSSGNWNNFDTSFITDFSGLPIRSFSIDNTNGFIAPTSLTTGDVDITPAAVPEPTSLAVWALLGVVGVAWRQRITNLERAD